MAQAWALALQEAAGDDYYACYLYETELDRLLRDTAVRRLWSLPRQSAVSRSSRSSCLVEVARIFINACGFLQRQGPGLRVYRRPRPFSPP